MGVKGPNSDFFSNFQASIPSYSSWSNQVLSDPLSGFRKLKTRYATIRQSRSVHYKAGKSSQGPKENGTLRMTCCRGVRGATTVTANTRDEILTATRQLVALMIRRNGIQRADVASAIFTDRFVICLIVSTPGKRFGVPVPIRSNHELLAPPAPLGERGWG